MKYLFLVSLLSVIISFTVGCKKSTDPEPVVNSSLVIQGNFIPNNGYNNFCVTSDGGIAVVARTAGLQLYVAKISAGLVQQWAKTFDSAVNNAGGICATSDGGLVVVSNMFDNSASKHRIRVRKLNSNGAQVWSKSWWFDIWDGQTFPIHKSADNGFVILVSDLYPGISWPNKPTLFKISASGDSLWSKGLMELHGNTIANDFLILPDGGFMISQRYRLMRTDTQCNKLWMKEMMVNFINLTALANDQFAVSCDSSFDQSPGHIDQQDLMLLKFDAAGNILMSGVYDHGFEDHSYSLATASDGGYLILAQDHWEMYAKPPYLIRTDQHGKEMSCVNLPGIFPCGLLKTTSAFVYYGANEMVGTSSFNLVLNKFQ